MQIRTLPTFDKQLKKNPEFQALFDNLAKKVKKCSEQELRDLPGTHLEPVKTNPPYQSIRASGSLRPLCLVEGDTLVFVSFPSGHEKSYGQGGKKGTFEFKASFLKAADYDYSTFQVRYTGKTEKEVAKFIEAIDLGDVYKDDDIKGKEDKVHTTILYGIKDKNPEKLPEDLKSKLPQTITWDGISKFSPEDEDYEVLIIKAVKSPELQALFDYLNEIYPDNANSFPDYVPHTTLAYVKKGTADKYIEAYPNKFKQEVKDFYFEFAFNKDNWKFEK